MRKIIMLLIAMLLSIAAKPQGLHETKMQSLAGINYYYTMNTVGCDTFGLNKITYMEPGYGFGAAFKHFELAKIIGLQAEINYDYQGFSIKPTSELYYKQMFKYINIPLLAHVDFGKHAFKGIFAVGAYGQILVDREKAKTNIADYDTSSLNRIHYGRYKTFSYGLCGQAGFAICTKAGVFEVLGRACIGMSKLMDMGELRLFNHVAGRSFGVGISYLVPLGKGEKYYTRREKIKEENPDVPETVHLENDNPEPENAESQESENENTEPSDSQENNAAPEIDDNWEDRMND